MSERGAVHAAFRAATECTLDLPGAGRTEARLGALFAMARSDLEVARLAEAHHDAVAIAAELGVALVPGARYGVWAASGPDPVRATAVPGGIRLRGVSPWCTGVGVVDRALVSAATEDGPVLVDIDAANDDGAADLDVAGVGAEGRRWSSPAFASTGTSAITFDRQVADDAVIGDAGAYLARAGFWHGAIGVAACWAGGLAGLVDLHVRCWTRRDPHSVAHLGSAVSWARCAVDVLRIAADDIDRRPHDRVGAQARARHVRHVVERSCMASMADLAVGAGPEPLAFDDAIVRRTQQLELYIRQCHGERDLEPLGAAILDATSGTSGTNGTNEAAHDENDHDDHGGCGAPVPVDSLNWQDRRSDERSEHGSR